MTDTRSDEAIVTAVIEGNLDDYAHIVQRYEQKLLRYVIVLIHDPVSAQDIVQDTFIKAYKNLNSFNDRYRFSPWLYRIAHNETMNYVKRNEKVRTDIELDHIPDIAQQPRVEHDIDQSFLARDMQKCLQEVDASARELLVLYYYENMKYVEISDVLHIPVSTVGVRLSRAKASLRRVCEAKGVHYEQT